MRTVLGIDLGTQALKVVFYDFEERRTVAVKSAPLDLHQDDTGRAEQQAHWWTDALRDALGSVDRNIRGSVAAIGVSGQQHGFVPIDKKGCVLAPVKLWCDTSTQSQCQTITEAAGGAEALLEGTGNPILPGYTASKILWFRHAHASLYSSMDGILLPHDYLNYYLTGERCMEMGDASGTGFLNIRTREWSRQVLAAFGAALQAIGILDGAPRVEDLVGDHLTRDEQRSCTPTRGAVNRYSNLYRDYQKAVEMVSALYT